jgi:hypothetical protein
MDNAENIQMQISIEYKIKESTEWKAITLSIDEYLDLEPDEEIEDCIPLYDHAIDYLDVDRKSISNTKLIVREANGQLEITTETFWNQGNNRITERTDSGPKSYWLMIIEIKLKDIPPTWEILRFEKEDGIPKLCYHVIIQENEDGSQSETVVSPE